MASSDARPIPIKNTAFRAVFPIYDADGDLVTGAAGLDSEVSKDQGTFTDCTNEATEIATSSGMYYLDLTSTEMNADCVAVIVKTSTSGAKTSVLVFYPEETGDINVDVTAFGGTAGTFSSGRPEVNTTHLAGTSQTGRDIGASVLLSSGTGAGQLSLSSGTVTLTDASLTAAKIASDAFTAAKFAADVTTELQSGLATAAALATVDGIVDDILADTADMQPKLGTPAGASISADIAAIEAQTDDIGTAGAGLTAIPWNAAWDAEVQSEVTDALNAYDPPTRAELTSDVASIPDSVWDEAIGDTTVTARQALKGFVAALLGKVSGAGTTTITFRNAADSADVIVATVDANGNRSAVTLTL